MSEDLVTYLNKPGGQQLLQGALAAALQALPAKLQRQPAAQWVSTIKALVQKGVKQAEIDDCEVLVWLAGQKGSLAREQVIEHVQRRQVTVKEVVLGQPKFSGYSHMRYFPAGQAQYKEILFIANSERANIEDRLEELDYQMEAFALDMEMLSLEPDRLFQLEAERRALMTQVDKAYEFAAHHFSSAVNGKHGKNLLAHGREIVAGDLYFISEIQSDWGQKGRRNDWKGIPKGPFVTDTSLWAGLVLKRMLQRAALNPQVKRVCWIRGSMRNGGVQVMEDNLDEFYLKTVGGIADRLIAGTGQKCRLQNLTMGTLTLPDVPTLDMTPEVRELLSGPLQLYSHAPVRKPEPPKERAPQLAAAPEAQPRRERLAA